MHKFENKFLAIYIILGGIWIIFSDKVLFYFIKDTTSLTAIQTFKGWFYVLITAIVFYLFLKNHLVKLRYAEKKAKESDRLKTSFLQNISHEIRTPMNSIIGFSELLEDDQRSDQEISIYTEMISKNSHQLMAIVNDILDFSLIDSGNSIVNSNKIHLNHLLGEIILLHKPRLKNEISLSLKKGLNDSYDIIYSDQIKLRQIIDNLLSNAIKYTNEGEITLGYEVKTDKIEFYIQDTGIGIHPDFHSKVFEQFYRADVQMKKVPKGVGLGLAICKGNIELLKGEIWIKSEINQGSTFFFTIPYQPESITI